ncbi:uncharacterized protein CANTADRAFT_23639 [Suhomyces tanzawaensis NRRL Y-17324]|uniref:Uncharacterized protein n=1 Tax=Suhomyces tanzawaensis NRRL Y-17324 TaxID=984487 RepID=A0A1E4SDQ6_9ASCO|nr:uncharacterized protein CANTADRAFT_23639 [Suhomyces tanzawaensis NRRL Y-17324]ODV77522.1 hypothetical protein CANTADRAFT_23639 [Suhomyces tanzawaensis NRRL Y-17324]
MLLLYLLSSLLTFFVPMALTIKALDKSTTSTTPPQSYQFLLNYWAYYAVVAHLTHTYMDRSDSVLLAATAFRLWLFYGQANNLKTTNSMLLQRVFATKDLLAFEHNWVDPVLRHYVVSASSRTTNVLVLQHHLCQLASRHELPAQPWQLSHPMRWLSRAVTAVHRGPDPESTISSTPSRKRSVQKAVPIGKSPSNHSLRSLSGAAGSVSPRRRSHRASDPPYPSMNFGDIPLVEHAIVDDIMDEMIQQPLSMSVYDDYFNNSYPQYPTQEAPAPATEYATPMALNPSINHSSGPAAPEPRSSYKINTGFFVQNKHKLFPKRETKPLPMAP